MNCSLPIKPLRLRWENLLKVLSSTWNLRKTPNPPRKKESLDTPEKSVRNYHHQEGWKNYNMLNIQHVWIWKWSLYGCKSTCDEYETTYFYKENFSHSNKYSDLAFENTEVLLSLLRSFFSLISKLFERFFYWNDFNPQITSVWSDNLFFQLWLLRPIVFFFLHYSENTAHFHNIGHLEALPDGTLQKLRSHRHIRSNYIISGWCYLYIKASLPSQQHLCGSSQKKKGGAFIPLHATHSLSEAEKTKLRLEIH